MEFHRVAPKKMEDSEIDASLEKEVKKLDFILEYLFEKRLFDQVMIYNCAHTHKLNLAVFSLYFATEERELKFYVMIDLNTKNAILLRDNPCLSAPTKTRLEFLLGVKLNHESIVAFFNKYSVPYSDNYFLDLKIPNES